MIRMKNEIQRTLQCSKVIKTQITKTKSPSFVVDLQNLNCDLKTIESKLPSFVRSFFKLQGKNEIELTVDKNDLIKDILNSYQKFPASIQNEIPCCSNKRSVIIEFSSPNIAKPFHCGHFRSTILGNFVSNLFEYAGHNVTRMNYIGDWGTQFGILRLGYSMYGDENKLKQDACNHLMQVYVKGNELCKDEKYLNQAKKYFMELEKNENDPFTHQYEEFKKLSLQEYERMYSKLKVKFDKIEYESMYKNAIEIFDQKLLNSSFITLEDGAKAFRTQQNEIVPLLKNDGSSLYLSRDILAAISRKEKYSFDDLYYVVDNAQNKHFRFLKEILKTMNFSWNNNLHHVSYGRINGMSTRKGNVTLLKDMLDEAKNIALKSTFSKKTSKVSQSEIEQVAQMLGISCLIVNDFRRRSQTNYNFCWETAMDQNGDSGISLQYAYSRLNNLQKNCGATLKLQSANEINMHSLDSMEAYQLCLLLSKFDEVLEHALLTLQPSCLVLYLFSLSRAMNKAYKVCKVKGEEDSICQGRLFMFHCTQNVFKKTFEILGIQPLGRI